LVELAYPVLEAEMRFQNLSLRKMLMKTDLKYSTMITKLKTGKNLSVDEGIDIKNALNTEKSVEELFGEKKVSA
jgi:hypothetical protein